jgi:hypothetical protein
MQNNVELVQGREFNDDVIKHKPIFKSSFEQVKPKYDYFYGPYKDESNHDFDNLEHEIDNIDSYKKPFVIRNRRQNILKSIK